MKRAIVGTLAFVGLATACTVMNGLDVIPLATEPTGEGTSSSGKTSSGTSGATSSSGTSGLDVFDVCTPLKEPAKPAAADPGGTDTPLTFAMKQLVSNNSETPFGLDLDGLCTCFTDKGKTTPGPDACKRTTSFCDDQQSRGLDNAGATLFKQINAQGGVNMIEVENSLVAEGKIGIVIQISDYNGLANDDAVTVKFIRSAGVSGGADFNTTQIWPTSGVVYTSTDGWVVTQTLKTADGGALTVRNLVAHFAEVEVPFLVSTPDPPKMRGAILTATIADGYAIPDLQIAGRTNTLKLVNQAGQLQTPFGTVCQSLQINNLYKQFGSAACAVSDMPSDPANDRDLGTPCDAMSFGVKMLLVPAILGANKSLPNDYDDCSGLDGYPLACPNP